VRPTDDTLCRGSLAAARKGHSRARHFGTTFTFLVQIFLACGAQHNICTQCFIWEVGSAAASVQARVTRVLASCAFESPDGTILLGISAASSSFGAFSSSHARLRHCCHCCSRRRCSRRHVQCLPVVRMLLHCALLRRCASPVHQGRTIHNTNTIQNTIQYVLYTIQPFGQQPGQDNTERNIQIQPSRC
jgi:hypothetical protein